MRAAVERGKGPETGAGGDTGKDKRGRMRMESVGERKTAWVSPTHHDRSIYSDI